MVARRAAFFASAFILVCLHASAISAQTVHVALPLKGQYQVGYFMPVDVLVDAVGSSNTTLTFRAAGALPTIVQMPHRQHVFVQMLMLSSAAREISWTIDEKVVGTLPIQAVDEMQLPRKIHALRWVDSLYPAIGPNSAIEDADAFAPTFSWQPGASARVRRTTMLSAVLVSTAMIACITLIRRRRTQLITALAVVGLSAAGIEIWRRQISPIWRAGGQIVTCNYDGMMQVDSWQYLTARSSASASVQLDESSWPIFVDEEHARALGATLHHDAVTGSLTLRCILRPGLMLAVCSRQIVNDSTLPATRQNSSPHSPMLALAQHLYRNADTSIVGEGEVEWIDDQTVRWPSIILRRSSRH